MAPIVHGDNYNSETRYIEQKFIIHFLNTEPLEVNRDNYLITSSILEEVYADSGSTPFGGITSNELSLSLLNEGGIFNPENTLSKYYGLITRGVKIEVFIRLGDSGDWDPFGVFYVTDWTTNSSDSIVDVTANDKLYSIINGAMPTFSVFRNITFKDFVTKYFSYFGYMVNIDETIDIVLPYVYISAYEDNKAFLSAIMNSALADCFCNHSGEIVVLSKVSKRPVKAVFTDDDQIINISIKQSLVTNYDSAVVICNKGQESPEQNLLSVNDIKLVPGINITDKFKVFSTPILCVKNVKVTCADDINIHSFKASESDISCVLQSTSDTTTNLDITGTILNTIISEIGIAGNTPLKVNSKFIQDENVATQIKEYTEAYVNINTPILDLSVRGNPKLELGDMIEVNSAYYKIKYYGTIIKANYEYQGYLSCALTLANASFIEKEE